MEARAPRRAWRSGRQPRLGTRLLAPKPGRSHDHRASCGRGRALPV